VLQGFFWTAEKDKDMRSKMWVVVSMLMVVLAAGVVEAQMTPSEAQVAALAAMNEASAAQTEANGVETVTVAQARAVWYAGPYDGTTAENQATRTTDYLLLVHSGNTEGWCQQAEEMTSEAAFNSSLGTTYYGMGMMTAYFGASVSDNYFNMARASFAEAKLDYELLAVLKEEILTPYYELVSLSNPVYPMMGP
jgi:hypothetical protein